MIDVSELVTDPDFCQNFTVYRSAGYFGSGGWIENTPTTLTVTGVVTVASERDLKQIPEGDRVEGAMMFFSTVPLYITRTDTVTGPGTSDQIEWRGERYRIARLWDYRDYGFMKAYAYRMKGS